MQKYNSRSEVEEEYKWDLTEYFKDEDSFNKALKTTTIKAKKLPKYVGCTKDPNKLYEFLNLEVEIITSWEDLYVYAYLINDQELGIKENIERKNKTEQLNLVIDNNISFFAPELLKLDKKEYNELFKKNKKLKEYKSLLDHIYREKSHILTEHEEVIVSSLINSMNHYDDISSTMLNTLHDYGKVKINSDEISIATNNYRHLMKEKNRDVRIKVRDQFQEKISEYSQVNATLLSSYISMNDTLAKIRKFPSSWDKKLFSWNLSDKVFKTLVSTVEKHLDSLQKYYNLKRKVLKLDKLTPYDTALELTKSKTEYSIKEAQRLVTNAIKILGEEYQDKFNNIIDKRCIDYCQYKGKCSGGYSFATANHNSRILMSFNGSLDSVSTIAHEGGHNVHHQFVKENNPPQYRDTPSIVAEVASLTNECLLSSYLAENGRTKDEKLSGIANILEVIVSNLFGAVREGKMEEEMYQYVHEGGILTKDYLDNLTYESLKKYYGNSVECDDKIKNNWVTRSHYYMNFYLYSYAICISVAAAISKKILSGNKETLDKYLSFLRTGSDKWPVEAYKTLGVDLEDEKVYCDAIEYFDSLINQFEKIYNE